MKFGLNLWNYCNDPTAEAAALCRRTAALGFSAVEIPVDEPSNFDVEEIKHVLDQTGLEVSLLAVMTPGRDISHVDSDVRKQTVNYLHRAIVLGEHLGTRVLAGPIYAGGGKRHFLDAVAKQAEWERAVEGLYDLASVAKEHGVKLALEPLNRYRTSVVNRVDQALQLIDDVGSAWLGILFDTYQANIEEANPLAALELALKQEKLFHVHACENHRGAPGSGHIDWDAYIQVLCQEKYEGHVTMETFCHGGFDSGFDDAVVSGSDGANERAISGLQVLQAALNRVDHERGVDSHSGFRQ